MSPQLKRTQLLHVVLALSIALRVCSSAGSNICPAFCDCDLHEHRNRAQCSARRLISANIEMPRYVEVLDLSYNDITVLENNCLQAAVHLLNLSLAHNAIHSIDLDAFSDLGSLEALDLSYNRLAFFDERVLETNRQLLYLNLEGNKFMNLRREPLLRSTSLETLNLRNSQINQLPIELLSALPQLQHLDLAQNLLITLNSAALNAPHYLKVLDLSENPLNCDAALKQIIRVLRKRGVELTTTDCFVSANVAVGELSMFERLTLNSGVHKSVQPEEPEIVVPEVWRTIPDKSGDKALRLISDNALCFDDTTEKLCQRYRSCLERNKLLMTDMSQPRDTPTSKMYRFTEDDVKLIFIVGIATGICFVIFIISFSLCLKNCCELQRKRRSLSDPERPVNTGDQAPPDDSDDVPAPRSRIPRRSNPQQRAEQRAIVRQPYGPQDSFISRLFGRPARMNYYRTLNQNTATLIRRLSRSNLFVNRSSQHFVAETEETPSTFGYCATAPANDGQEMQRAETPPPKYGDIVSN